MSPSPSRSAALRLEGLALVGKTSEVAKVPSPSFFKTETSLLPRLEVAKSKSLSPSRSAAITR